MEQEIESLQRFYHLVIEFFVNYSFQVVGAIIIILLGWMASKWAYRVVVRQFEKHQLDVTLGQFTANVTRFLVLAAALIIALGKFGISIAPFIAAIGAISLTAGLALQGSISNYGAGLSLIISRPFVVGDTIVVNGVFGVVEEIKLGYTLLRTEDEELITIPNKHMIGEILVNSFEYRIVEGSIGISYNDKPDVAIEVIKNVLASHGELSKDHSPVVGVEAFADSSINIGIRYWVPTKRYFQTQYEINLEIFDAIQSVGLTIPYPQRDIHMIPTA